MLLRHSNQIKMSVNLRIIKLIIIEIRVDIIYVFQRKPILKVHKNNTLNFIKDIFK